MIPYKYYFFGSENSSDDDVLVEVEEIKKPHENIAFIKNLKKECSLDWDINLIVVKEGRIIDTMSRKGTVDSVNNSLLCTYDLHKDKQKYPNPITVKLQRQKLLATFRCIRNVLSFCSKTSYRKSIKTVLKKGYYNSVNLSFDQFVDVLKKIDFTTIENFNKEITDVDVWKKIAFFFGQTIALLSENIEIYTKNEFISKFPNIEPFITRKPANYQKQNINSLRDIFVEIISNFEVKCVGNRLLCLNEEIIDVELENIINHGK